jgi:hypothetical protein
MKNNTFETKNIKEWSKDKNPMFASIALIIAVSAEDWLELFETVKAGRRIEGYIPLPPIGEWLSLYRNHRKVRQCLMNTLRNDESMAKLMDFYDHMLSGNRKLRKTALKDFKKEITKLTYEEKKQSIKNIQEVFQEHHEFIVSDVISDECGEKKELDEESKEKIRELVSKPEILCFLRVWAPCFMLYGTYPPYLLRKARHGDEDALEKLIRLDKSVIYDTKIREIIHQATAEKRRGKIDLITKAMRASPIVKIDIRKVKYTLAGLISIISMAMGQKITAAEINRLFDAIYRDMGKGHIDPDFIEEPRLIAQAINRSRSFWKIIP